MKKRTALILTLVSCFLALWTFGMARQSDYNTQVFLEFPMVINCYVKLNHVPIDEIMPASADENGTRSFLTLEFYNYCQDMVVPQLELFLADSGKTYIIKKASGKFKIEKADYDTLKVQADLYDLATGKKVGKMTLTGVIDVSTYDCKVHGIYNILFDFGKNNIVQYQFSVNYTDGEPGPDIIAYSASGVYMDLDDPFTNFYAATSSSSNSKLNLTGIDVLVPMINCGQYPSPYLESGLMESFTGSIKQTISSVDIQIKAKKLQLSYKIKDSMKTVTDFYRYYRHPNDITATGQFNSGCSCSSKKIHAGWVRYSYGETCTFGEPCNPCYVLPLWGDMDDEYPGNDDNDSANDYGVIRILYSWIFDDPLCTDMVEVD